MFYLNQEELRHEYLSIAKSFGFRDEMAFSVTITALTLGFQQAMINAHFTTHTSPGSDV
jgi:hypothetical protein